MKKPTLEQLLANASSQLKEIEILLRSRQCHSDIRKMKVLTMADIGQLNRAICSKYIKNEEKDQTIP